MNNLQEKTDIKAIAIENILATRAVSGHGGYHSANPKSANPKPYTSISFENILSMVKTPASVEKQDAQWAIFSTTHGNLARSHSFQRSNGQYFCLWADLDKLEGKSFFEVCQIVQTVIPGQHVIYTTKSATPENPKCRVLVPLTVLVPGSVLGMLTKILNDRIQAAGLTPDRVSERPGQLCYLPNKGEFYQHQIIDGPCMDPYHTFSAEIVQEQARVKAEELDREQQREKRELERNKNGDDGLNTIEIFDQEYPPEQLVKKYKYTKHGKKWLSALSTSGEAGFEIHKDGKSWSSYNDCDAEIGHPYKNGIGVFGDSFDLYRFYEHGGDYNQALKAAGEMLKTTDNQGKTITVNKAKQREFKKAEAKQTPEQMFSDVAERGSKVNIPYFVNGSGVCCREVSRQLGIADNKVFRYGGQLIKIVNSPPTSVRLLKKSSGGQYPSMPIISHLKAESLTHEIEKIAVCQTEKKDGETKNTPWPKRIIQGVLEMTEYNEQPLIGVVEHPYIDYDFNPITEPGYDPSTGLYKCFNGEIRNHFPTAADALAYLTDFVFADFPFSTKLDQLTALSCILTGMQRKLISDNSGCPGYLFTAPVQSSGKTTLAQVISHSLYGRPAAASTFSDDNAEMAKHLLGILQEGQSFVLFDNLPEGSVVESNELAKVLTSDSYSNRWLGKNQTVTVPCSVLWMFTGNNVSVCGDFNTRILPIELDPRMANPDQRRFSRGDVGSWCEQHREKILSACMQVVMAGKDFNQAVCKPSRFPSWDKFVRYPLLKITGEDIGEIFQKNKQADPKLEGQRNFFEAWFNTFGSTPQTAKQVLNRTYGVQFLRSDNILHEAMQDIFAGQPPTTRSLGKWLSGMKNRFFDSYKLISAGTGTNRSQQHKALWKVQNCNK